MPSVTSSGRRAQARVAREESRARIVAAAEELVRRRSFPQISVSDVMEQAELERTLFYRHFDDLADLLRQAAREAFEELYETEVDLGPARDGAGPAEVRAAIEPAAGVYERHGPLLRALSEAASADDQIAAGQAAMRQRFDELVAEALAGHGLLASKPASEVAETARALNLMNESFLLDAFGREPRMSAEHAVQTLSEIWLAVIGGIVPGAEGEDGG